MKRIVIVIMLMSFLVSNSFAFSAEEKVLESANSMKKFLNSNKIPHKVFNFARAIVIIPSSVKVGFLLGVNVGDGVVIFRKDDGTWSYPAFVSLRGGSFGYQFGFENTDILLIFKSKDSVDGLKSGKFTLGVGASISAGPLNANVDKSTEGNMSAEIYSYASSSGLFVGASFGGAKITLEKDYNKALYGNDINLERIINSHNLSDAYSITEFMKNTKIINK